MEHEKWRKTDGKTRKRKGKPLQTKKNPKKKTSKPILSSPWSPGATIFFQDRRRRGGQNHGAVAEAASATGSPQDGIFQETVFLNIFVPQIQAPGLGLHWGADVRGRRWVDVRMWGDETVKIWRWDDVRMWGSENVRIWRWHDVRMCRCERLKFQDMKMRWHEGVRMWRCQLATHNFPDSSARSSFGKSRTCRKPYLGTKL